MDKSLIQIFRGDDTDGLGYQSIQGKITTTLDLTGCRAVFRYLGFTQEFDPIPENGRITITIPASKTSKFPPGLGYASLRVYDSEGKVRTFTNRIPVFVTVYAPSECGGEFEVVFNGGNLELEPLKIKSVNGYRIYDGYLEQIIDKATAIEYGLALLFDSGDLGKDANSGYAATPKAVRAAYDTIIGELTDNYYSAEETEEAIDRIAAYYITSDAQGNPFATYAALAGATAFYSGGQLRTPTRNDYCVVLADETHGGEQYRYIYSVNQQGAGQWEAQYAVGGSVELDNTVTRTSTNGVKSSGIWSAIWGALPAPPGFSSLHDWCVAQLAGKAPATNIAKSALASDVQASLGKADTALQTAPVTSVNGKTGAVVLNTTDIQDNSTGTSLASLLSFMDGNIQGKAPLASPAFTGTPTAPTPASGDNSTKVATTAFVQTAVDGVPLRYDMPSSVALVADNDAATLVCADRAVTNATIADGFSTLNLTFPDAVSGKVRDFYLRIVVAAGESAPALSVPSGITIENPDGAVPEIADGETDAASTTLVWFSETAPNVFTAKSETVKAVA